MVIESAAQPGFALWFTGLPSSGKTTVAERTCGMLSERGVTAAVLNSARLRKVLTPRPLYTDEERDWFYGVLVYLAEHLTESGVNVVICATAPRRYYRATARLHIEKFAEVFVDCPESVCRSRDPKGLWRKADRGEIRNLPGAGVLYEKPTLPEIHIQTARSSVADGACEILRGLEVLGFIDRARRGARRRSSDGKVIFL